MRCGAPDCAVAHDEHVGVHRHQVVDGVEQRLALAGRRRADVEVDHVGRQPLGGDLERRARARRVLEEQVEHRACRAAAAPSSPRARRSTRTAPRCRGCGRMISAGRPSSVSRCVSSPSALSCGLRIARTPPSRFERRARSASVRIARQHDRQVARDREPRADIGRLRSAARGRRGRPARRARCARPAVVEQLVDRRAHAASGVEHVVDQHDASRRRRRTAAPCA